MKCEKCGKEINCLAVNLFNYDGSDSFDYIPFSEAPVNAVSFDINRNWTGYELSDDERIKTIECPHCHEFPFEDKEIQVYEIVRVVCFKKGEKDENIK